MENFAVDKMLQLSKIMEVEVKFNQDKEGGEKVEPVFDASAIISKMLALFVFCGANIPSTFAPSYNRVHADVEYWSKKAAENGVPKSE